MVNFDIKSIGHNINIVFDTTTIMLVTYSPSMQSILKKSIQNMNDCEIVNSSLNGKQALLYLKRKSPDVILLDMELPDMDGFTFLENLRQLAPIPVIITSVYAKGNSFVLTQALNSGALDYVVPPEKPKDLKLFSMLLRRKIIVSLKKTPKPIMVELEAQCYP